MTILSALAALVLAVFAAAGLALIAYRLRAPVNTLGDVALMLAVTLAAAGCAVAAVLVWPVK